jgi:ubiquinone/menaquinone biosynthesis C-methylase UbiE
MHASPDQPAASPAETYEAYFVPAMFRPWLPDLFERTQPQPGDRVLDLACGTGIVSRSVAPLVGPSGSVVGIDISPAMLEVARTAAVEGAPVTWLEGDAQVLPFPDASFDIVLCQQGLQFFPDRQAGVNEMGRVLVSGGRVGTLTWRGTEHCPLIAIFGEIIERRLGQSATDTPFSLGDPDELRRLFETAGFREIQIESIAKIARFPNPDRFVSMTIRAAAAVVPEFAELDGVEQETLVAAIQQDMEGPLQEYIHDDAVHEPMAANLTSAVR